MKKNIEVKKTEKKIDKKGIFIKVMAGCLCFLMVFTSVISLVYALMR